MSLSSPFIRRPVATALLTVAILLAGSIAYTLLPISPLPQVDFPTIVKKNAFMMIDFALAAERDEGLSSRDSIFKACRCVFVRS